MGVQWTEEQREVIDVRGKNILVSAAAGSGKTAVLVERIIERLTKEEPPLDVDRLLVVTYTEAAAAEMKERIRDAIEKTLEDHPDDAFAEAGNACPSCAGNNDSQLLPGGHPGEFSYHWIRSGISNRGRRRNEAIEARCGGRASGTKIRRRGKSFFGFDRIYGSGKGRP